MSVDYGTLVSAALVLLCVAGAVGGWWSARRAVGLVDEAREAAQATRLDAEKASRSAAAARRKLDAVVAGRLPMVAVLQRWGLDEARADAMAREVQDRVRRETGSRLEGHPVGSSAAFRPTRER